MNCAAFERWLDEGRPEPEAPLARAHARDCEPCALALDAALELDAALGSPLASPPGFTDRVMARVAETPQVAAPFAAVAPPTLPPALPWWVRATLQPTSILAVVLVALLVGWGDDLARGVMAWTPLLANAPARLGDPRVVLAAAIALAPSVAWASRRLYAWGRTFAA